MHEGECNAFKVESLRVGPFLDCISLVSHTASGYFIYSRIFTRILSEWDAFQTSKCLWRCLSWGIHFEFFPQGLLGFSYPTVLSVRIHFLSRGSYLTTMLHTVPL